MRTLAVIATLAGSLSALTGVASAADQPDSSPPPLRASLETCLTGGLPEQRVTEFAGSMPARSDATRMRMRFDLQRRHGHHHWRRVSADGFGTWERSLPDRAGFIFHKRVLGLPVPARYRAVVRFAWEAADGTVVARARRATPSCHEPDLRPDLVPGALSEALTADPTTVQYSVLVRNGGRSPSGSFVLRVAGSTAEAASLDAGETRAIVVAGPPCAPGSPLFVKVDDDHRVDESAERGNAEWLTCPLLPAA